LNKFNITIIVLLILAGVSISLVVGDNGVLTQAQNSSKETEVAKAKEAVETAISSIQANFVSVHAANRNLMFMGYLGATGNDPDSQLTSTNCGGYTVAYTMPTGDIEATSVGVGNVLVNGKYYWFQVTGTSNKLGATVVWNTTSTTTNTTAPDF